MKKDVGWIWDTCIKFIYDEEYPKALAEFLKASKSNRILDASCGIGFPAIGLRKQGFDIVCSDASTTMLKTFYRNCVKEGVRIESKRLFWNELSENFKEEFDCVMCRGNSLPYVVSWENEKPDLSMAEKEIEEALKNFHAVLRKGGICYVDLSPREAYTPEQTHFVEEFAEKELNGKILGMVWNIRHDLVNKVRTWEPEIIIRHKNSEVIEKAKVSYKAYHLRHSELISLMKKAGFRDICQYVEIKGEKNYDIFIGCK